MIYFTSDTHFGHKNILKYCNRPFNAIEEHDEALIEAWNATVSDEDLVYHLGDFAFVGKDRAEEIIKSLNGFKIFLRGNHDKVMRSVGPKLVKQGVLAKFTDYLELKIPDKEMDLKQNIVLCHYPFESWNKRHHGSWHLHGHCHGTLPSGDHQARVDVGVDVWGYAPVSYERIKEHMTSKVFKPIDHHSEGGR